MSALDCPELRGTRVLLVEDDADNRDLLMTLFERNGALVATADSAAEALRQVQRARPQVLISDIGLPDVDGFSLLRTLRALPASDGGDIPAIALTGYRGVRNPHKDGGECFQAHLTKPVALGEMLTTVARVLRAGPVSKRR
ncbi:MAG: response regulator [Myxococcota bacterium]|nr:response regulator [Myxococcota bacterium]